LSPQTPDLESRLEKLETLAAYQEQAIEDLNAVVTGQRREIEQLQRQLARLSDEVQEIGADPALAGRREPPPPHY